MTPLLFATAGATTPDGGPDVLVTSDCPILQSGFADVDADGVDDLVLQVDERVYGWPSSSELGKAPIRWDPDGADPELGAVYMGSATGSQPARLHWVQSEFEDEESHATEYEVDSQSFDLTTAWSVIGTRRTGDSWYVGDLDGDSVSELAAPNEFRSSAQADWVPYPGDVVPTYENWFNPWGFSGVGDVDGDGFGDVVVGWEDSLVYYSCVFYSGPASLYLGRPHGLSAQPLWTLWDDTRQLAVGQTVVSVPEQDALIVDLKIDAKGCYDGSPLHLGVIRDASTPDAYLSQVFEVPELDPNDGWSSKLFGMLQGPMGPTDIAVMDSAGNGTGVLWYRWDPASVTLGEQPEVQWSSTVALAFDQPPIAWPVGRRNQAMSMIVAPGGYPSDLAVWGRTIENVGPATTGSTADGECTFFATEPPPPPPPPPPATTTTEPPPPDTVPPSDPPSLPALPPSSRSCGCAAGVGSPAFGAVALLIARRRRTAPAVAR